MMTRARVLLLVRSSFSLAAIAGLGLACGVPRANDRNVLEAKDLEPSAAAPSIGPAAGSGRLLPASEPAPPVLQEPPAGQEQPSSRPPATEPAPGPRAAE